MGTPLGAGVGSQFRIGCMNVSAADIPAGVCVSIDDTDTTKYLPLSLAEDVLPVAIYASGGLNQCVGTTTHIIKAGETGEIVLVGLVRVLSGGAIAAGAAIGPNAVGKWDDAASTLPGNLDAGLAFAAAAGADESILAFINLVSWDGSYQAP